MTADLVKFLRDRYDEEAAEALAAEKRTTTTRRMIQGQWVEDTIQPPEWRRSAWSPARVLREIEAKRQVLDLHREIDDPQEMQDYCTTCEVTGDYPYYPCMTLRLLALPYSDRPGFKESWRP